MNSKLTEKAKNYFEKYFFKLIDNSVFGKGMENVRKHKDIKLVATGKRENQQVSEPNYHSTKFFTEILLPIKIRKFKIFMNRPVYSGPSMS